MGISIGINDIQYIVFRVKHSDITISDSKHAVDMTNNAMEGLEKTAKHIYTKEVIHQNEIRVALVGLTYPAIDRIVKQLDFSLLEENIEELNE